MSIKNTKEVVLEYIKEPTFIFLLVFLFSLGTVLYKTVQIENVIKNYEKYNKILNNLNILDNDFDIFLSQKLTFINYDDISSDVRLFEKNLRTLQNDDFIGYYNEDLKTELKNLKVRFNKKINLLERYKSYNAVTISSLSYILNFAQAMRCKNDRCSGIYKAVFDLSKLFIGINLEKKTIEQDIRRIDEIYKKSKIKDLKYLRLNIKHTAQNILTLNLLSKETKSIKLKESIKLIEKKIEQRYKQNINNLKISALVLFVISILLLLVFLYRYIIFIRNAKDLTSFKYAIENSDNIIVITDVDRHITYVNEAFTKNTGYSKEEVLGENPRILKSGMLPQEFYDEMNLMLDQGKKWNGDFINKNKYGKIYYEKASITPIYRHKKLIGYIAIKLNVTDYIEQEKRVIYLAQHDQLTGLKNRRAMEYEVEQYIKDAEQLDKKVAILFLDLDNFKIVNDSLGHNIGDILLKAIAKRLSGNLDNSDSIYRLGGDEFAIVITKDVNKENIFMIVKRVMEIISKPIIIKKNEISTTVSIGISFYPEDGMDLNILLKNADIAMYNSKMSGKNRYKFYQENFSKEIQKRINIEQELGNALKNGEFSVVYQPKYSLQSRKILALELLIRWNNEKLGIISPEIFIPIAESLGLVYDIGKYVFREACRDFKYLKQHLVNLKHISVNVSTAQLNYQNLKKDFKEIMDKEKVSPTNLAIEITETSLMRNIEENAKILSEIKKMGITICMDDFGTGYSSLNYLIQLPIDNIKIDKTFVDVIFSGKKELEMIKAIVSISDNFNFHTIAEGIETKEQEEILKNLGVDLGQGYYFSKPLPKEELVAKFKLSL
ncbi:MAG: EAL domain-containing protein [Sulfurospirillum sp.]